MQTACERDTPLASAPTLSRLENRATRSAAYGSVMRRTGA
jgi:hypothetical protein